MHDALREKACAAIEIACAAHRDRKPAAASAKVLFSISSDQPDLRLGLRLDDVCWAEGLVLQCSVPHHYHCDPPLA